MRYIAAVLLVAIAAAAGWDAHKYIDKDASGQARTVTTVSTIVKTVEVDTKPPRDCDGLDGYPGRVDGQSCRYSIGNLIYVSPPGTRLLAIYGSIDPANVVQHVELTAGDLDQGDAVSYVKWTNGTVSYP